MTFLERKTEKWKHPWVRENKKFLCPHSQPVSSSLSCSLHTDWRRNNLTDRWVLKQSEWATGPCSAFCSHVLVSVQVFVSLKPNMKLITWHFIKPRCSKTMRAPFSNQLMSTDTKAGDNSAHKNPTVSKKCRCGLFPYTPLMKTQPSKNGFKLKIEKL